MFARARVLARPLRVARRGLAAPKSKKSKQASQAADNDHKDAAYDFYKAIIDAPKRKRPKLPDDVAAAHFAIGREYNQKSRAKHDAFEARLQMKLDLQQAALDALPVDLRRRAKTLEGVPLPPLDRRVWTLTPPIPGFRPEDHVDEDD
jgi:hypothetical protein